MLLSINYVRRVAVFSWILLTVLRFLGVISMTALQVTCVLALNFLLQLYQLLCFAETNNCKLINQASTADDSIPIYGWLFEQPVLAVGDGPGEGVGNYGTKYWFDRFDAQNCENWRQDGGGSASSSCSTARHKPAGKFIRVNAVTQQASGTETSGSDEDENIIDEAGLVANLDGPERAAINAASAPGAAERVARCAHRNAVRDASVATPTTDPTGVRFDAQEDDFTVEPDLDVSEHPTIAAAEAIPPAGAAAPTTVIGGADLEGDAHTDEPQFTRRADLRPGFDLARSWVSTGVIGEATQDLLRQLYLFLASPAISCRNSSYCGSSDTELSERQILDQDMETSQTLERIFIDLYSSQQRTTALLRARNESMGSGDGEYGQEGAWNDGLGDSVEEELQEKGQEQGHDDTNLALARSAAGDSDVAADGNARALPRSAAGDSNDANGTVATGVSASALARIQRETGCLLDDSMAVVSRIMNAHALRHHMPYMSISPEYAHRCEFVLTLTYIIIVVAVLLLPILPVGLPLPTLRPSFGAGVCYYQQLLASQ